MSATDIVLHFVDCNHAAGEPVYTFSDWVEEDMGIARVGGDATLLPNGDVVIVNGGQVREDSFIRT